MKFISIPEWLWEDLTDFHNKYCQRKGGCATCNTSKDIKFEEALKEQEKGE